MKQYPKDTLDGDSDDAVTVTMYVPKVCGGNTVAI